jgi:hypothetical protein
MELLVKRTPRMVRLAVVASVGTTDAGRAQAEFRDELVALVRDSTEASWLELRRGVDDLDVFSRPDQGKTARPPCRPYRVKS